MHPLGEFYEGKPVRLHPIYSVWANLKDRCHNPQSKDFPRYGARGIIVCKDWRQSALAFIDWAMKNGYSKGLQIDRQNNDGNYEPENCRFVTPKVNSNNRRQRSHYRGKLIGSRH